MLLWLSFLVSKLGMAQLKEVESRIYRWDELPKKESPERIGRKILEGYTPHLKFLEIHATTQQKGAKPAAPHTQKNIEELIIVKEGLMKMTIDGKSEVIKAGGAILIPPLAEQSMENIGDGPMIYYVIMFTSKTAMNMDRSEKAGGALFLNAAELTSKKIDVGSRVSYFDRGIAMCERFEMHTTQLDDKVQSHKPHQHTGSEIILVIEGQTEMLIGDSKYPGKAGDLYFIKSNDLHGISNIGDEPCRYYAIRWFF